MRIGQKFEKNSKSDSAIFYFEKARRLYSVSHDVAQWLDATLHIGENYVAKNALEKGQVEADTALAVAKKHGTENSSLLIRAYVLNGKILGNKGDFSNSLAIYRNALRIFPAKDSSLEIANLSRLIGMSLFNAGFYDSASVYLYASLARLDALHGQGLDRATVYSDLGQLYYQKGRLDKAYEYYTLALSCMPASMDPREISAVYNNIATTFMGRGDYEQANVYFFKSLGIKLDLGETSPAVAVNYNNIAMTYRFLENYGPALEYGHRALTLFEKLVGKEHPNTGSVIHNIGRIYADQGEWVKALDLYREAQVIWAKKLGAGHPNVSQSYFNLANVFLNMKLTDSARVYFEKSLVIRKKSYGEKHPKTAEAYEGLGRAAVAANTIPEALGFLQRALISLVEDFSDTSIFANPEPDHFSSEQILISILDHKASALDKISLAYPSTMFGTTGNYLSASLKTYHLAADWIERARQGYKAEESKLFLAAQSHKIFERALVVALRQYRLTGKKADAEEVFQFSERSKAAILSQSMADTKAKVFGGIPDSLSAKEKSLRAELVSLENLVLKQKDKDSVSLHELKNQFFSAHRTYNELIQKLERDFPRYYALKYQSTLITLADLQKTISPSEIVIDFFEGDDSLYAMVIGPSRLAVVTIDMDTLLKRNIEKFYKSIKKIEIVEFKKYSYDLYRQLMKPLESHWAGSDKLIIIPDGVLFYVPFEALISERPDDEKFSKYAYLAKRFDVSYHYSASLLVSTVKPLSERHFVGFAPVFPDETISPAQFSALDSASISSVSRDVKIDGKKFASLPASENEVNSIAELFVKDGREAKKYLFDEASEARFKASVPSTDILHIATHGIMNETNPKLSGIIFASPTDSSREDGILYAGETYNLTLRANLVVLSSCESGIGRLHNGEGMMALSRAFLYAGAQNIMYSLWKVDDRPTSELMIGFYRNYLGGNSYAHALREAKLQFIKNPATAFPKNWSGFILIGK